MDIKPTGSFAQSGSLYLNNGMGNVIPQATRQIGTGSSSAAVVAPPAGAKVSEEQIAKALEGINKTMQNLSSAGLEFSVDADSNRTIVKVVDRQTQEIIRQMPTKEALEIAKALDRLQGLLIHQKA